MTHLNLKIGEKQKFALRLIARIKGDSTGAALEQTIEGLANGLQISRHWLELYDDEPAVAMLNLFALPEYKAPVQAQKSSGLKDEALARALVMGHSQFFYSDAARIYPRRKFAVLLWPHVEEMAKLWKRQRDEDYYVAAKAMLAIMKKPLKDDPDYKALVKTMAAVAK